MSDSPNNKKYSEPTPGDLTPSEYNRCFLCSLIREPPVIIGLAVGTGLVAVLLVRYFKRNSY